MTSFPSLWGRQPSGGPIGGSQVVSQVVAGSSSVEEGVGCGRGLSQGQGRWAGGDLPEADGLGFWRGEEGLRVEDDAVGAQQRGLRVDEAHHAPRVRVMGAQRRPPKKVQNVLPWEKPWHIARPQGVVRERAETGTVRRRPSPCSFYKQKKETSSNEKGAKQRHFK